MTEAVATLPSTSSTFPLSTSTSSKSPSEQPTGTAPQQTVPPQSSGNVSSSNQTGQTALTTPPELEQTLAMLSAHRTVLGYLLLSRTTPVKIIRHSGVVFEGEQGKKYAGAIGKMIEAVRSGLDDIAGDGESDEVRFMRIRTKRHELMISPDERYLLAVLHDPSI